MAKSMTRRRALAVIGAAPVAMNAHALPTSRPKRGGALRAAYFQTPTTLNGALQAAAATTLISTQLFASPIRFDDKWNAQPYLASSWVESADKKSLKLHIRENAKFHDGHPVRAEDVAFSIMAIKANHPFQALRPVTSVEIDDDHTVVIHTEKPFPALMTCLSPALCPIMPKHVYDDGHELRSNPHNVKDVVGSGPFRLLEFVPDQHVRMERFKDYFLAGRPYVDSLTYTINRNLLDLVLEFKKGMLDLLPMQASVPMLKQLRTVKDAVLTQKGYEGIGAMVWLEFNCAKLPWSDPKVRHAVAMALDKNFYIQKLASGFPVAEDGPIPKSDRFYSNAACIKYPFNLEEAKKILDGAGYEKGSDGVRFKMAIDFVPGDSRMLAEYLTVQLKKLDIATELRVSADFPSWAKRMAAHDFDVDINALFEWGDPAIGVARNYMSTNIKPIIYTNTSSYRNVKVDELLTEAAVEGNYEKRTKLYHEFQRLVTQDLPMAYISNIPFHTAAQSYVANVPTSIWGPFSPLDEVSV